MRHRHQEEESLIIRNSSFMKQTTIGCTATAIAAASYLSMVGQSSGRMHDGEDRGCILSASKTVLFYWNCSPTSYRKSNVTVLHLPEFEGREGIYIEDTHHVHRRRFLVVVSAVCKQCVG